MSYQYAPNTCGLVRAPCTEAFPSFFDQGRSEIINGYRGASPSDALPSVPMMLRRRCATSSPALTNNDRALNWAFFPGQFAPPIGTKARSYLEWRRMVEGPVATEADALWKMPVDAMQCAPDVPSVCLPHGPVEGMLGELGIPKMQCYS